MSEPDVSDLLTVTQAIEVIDAADVTPRVIDVALADADGLVLAEDLVADRDYPPFDKSLMDGYAVRCSDLAEKSQATLKVVGEVAAGQSADRALAPGEALAIMTGAPMPECADGVVPVEDTQRLPPSPAYSGERAGERGEVLEASSARSSREPLAPLPNPLPASGKREQDEVHILRATTPGRFIARRGSDVRQGALVLRRGVRLGPAQIAVAASVGAARVKVYAMPRVGVLSTGDELVPIDQVPGPAQIRNSNSVMLVALLKRLGCHVAELGVVRDTPEAVREALQRAMSQCDVLFVTGGMSMGAYDYVPRTLLELGVDLRITKLRIKPGKPFVFGVREKKGTQLFLFGLPGNPVSGFVCTVRLAARLLARLNGANPEPRWISAKLLSSLKPNGPREFYQPAKLMTEGVVPLEWKGSADVYTLAAADALLVRAENEPALEAGSTVRVLELPS